MSKNFSMSLSTLFKLTFTVNTVLVVVFLFISYSLHRSGVQQVVELGKISVQAFRAARPMLWSQRGLDSAQMRNFVEELAKKDSVKNFVIYTSNGNILFEFAKHYGWQLITPVPEKPLIVDNVIVFYDNYHFDVNRSEHGGRHMFSDTNSPALSLYFSLAIDATHIKYTRFFRNISFVVAFIMQLLFIIFFIKLKKMLNEHETAQKKIAIMQQEALTGRFAAILAHEIKNPLSSIKGLVQFSIKKTDSPVVVENLERSIDEVDRLTEIVNGFLTFGKPIELEFTKFSIKSMINKAILLLVHDTDSSGKTIEVTGSDFTINADFNKILQVIVNLLVNALEAAPSDSVIQIRLENKNIVVINDVNSELQKTDIIKKELINQETFFEPFFTTKSQGSGLGLAVSKKIIDIHDFTITVDSTDPFIVTINFSKGAVNDLNS